MILAPLMIDTTVQAVIEAPIERIDLTDWIFELSTGEYQACSPDHIAAGAGWTADGRRLSINVERIGGDLLVQHYVQDSADPRLCRGVSRSDVFHRLGRTTLDIVWEISVEPLESGRARLTNRILGHATPDLLALLETHGVAFEAAAAEMQALAEAHNAIETPGFALNIAARALGEFPRQVATPALDLSGGVLADTRCEAVIAAPIEAIDLCAWLFSLSDTEYQACSVAHIAAGVSASTVGKPLSINVENPGSLIIQQYQPVAADRDRCTVASPRSTLIGPDGLSTLSVVWALRLRPRDAASCILENHVVLRATPEFEALLSAAGVPLEAARAQRGAIVAAHNEEETPKFAADIEAKANAGRWIREQAA